MIDSFAHTPDVRFHELMCSLTEHMHASIRGVRLSESEWNAAIEFLTAVEHITDDRRQEFILLSDVFGASMQTVTLNHQPIAEETEATVLGPFFVEASHRIEQGGDIAKGASGQPF